MGKKGAFSNGSSWITFDKLPENCIFMATHFLQNYQMLNCIFLNMFLKCSFELLFFKEDTLKNLGIICL